MLSQKVSWEERTDKMDTLKYLFGNRNRFGNHYEK